MDKKVSFRLFLLAIALVFGIFNNIQVNASTFDYIEYISKDNSFPVVEGNVASPLIIDQNDFQGVKNIAGLFQTDIYNVTGINPKILDEKPQHIKNAIIIGTLGKSRIVNELVRNGKLDVSDLNGKWETSLIQVIEKPFENIERALLIVGSDKRGTIYGMFDISRKMGVSPWYWWADVPVKKHKDIYIKTGRYNLGEPKVKYRGIFLNDEEPALGSWAVEHFGGFTHEFYEKVFELLLRLKANYMWPAMWNSSFNSDDTLNPVLADEMGIVMGTSHHEPMMRAHMEWRKNKKGEWDYTINEDELKKFWKEGIERMGNKESIVTMGMRGDGDEAMSEEANTLLLEKIIADQRKIIEEVTGDNAEKIPQMWALYKEVQEYYDKGMTVPDDITLLLCDDNWGNVRYLPDIDTPKPKGGYGMYYHFDFVGGPRSYKWLNVTHLSRVWEQMNLCYRYGVDRIWLVNVGDLKPMELPISFFIDFAWDPEQWPASRLMEYHQKWAKEQFGEEFADEIAEILWLYTKYNRRRTPEMLDFHTYSLTNYREYERVTDEYNGIYQKSVKIYDEIESIYRDSYFQLVHHPVWACSNLYNMYFAQAKNNLFYMQGRAATNDIAKEVQFCFNKDIEITRIYHEDIANGKWNHIMSQTHIGYRSWRDPRNNIMPKTKTLDISDQLSLGITYLGTDTFWLFQNNNITLPAVDSYNKQLNYLEIYNQGKESVGYELVTDSKWIILSNTKGNVVKQDTIKIDIDWDTIGYGNNEGEILVKSLMSNKYIKIKVPVIKHNEINERAIGFIERDGYVSIEANNYTKAIDKKGVKWTEISGMSRTGSGITPMPVNISFLPEDKDLPALEYNFYLLTTPTKDVTIHLNIAPTHNLSGKGLFFAIAIDDEEPQIIDIHEANDKRDWEYPDWYSNAVGNYTISISTEHKISGKGSHTLKLYNISSGVVFQKIVIDNGGLKWSYLGPPESVKK